MKIALVHDWLTNMAGSEQVVANFRGVYPEAPIYTTVYNPDKLDDVFKNADVRTSFLQNNKKAREKHQSFFPFMPMAFESFDLNEYDIVLSSSHSTAKGVITNPAAMHVCYCHSPMRYGWEFYYEYTEEMGKIKKKLLKYFMNYMRVWDQVSSNRVDYFIANSANVSRRIWKHYRRESVVIHPPVRWNMFNISNEDEPYFLILTRLVKYKRVDLAVKAFNELGLPLVIIGDGEEREKLQQMAKSNITFLGRQSDEAIKEYYSKCRAFIFPGEEDFGITPLEAMSSGRPVIAFGKGGALETVVENKTGIFFKEQTTESLVEAVKKFETVNFDKNEIRQHAYKWDEVFFKQKIEKFVADKYEEFQNTKHWTVL